jgi:hypothetical protein
MTLKQAAIFGLVFGIIAALLVWYLERFELNRLHAEVKDYLSHQDSFTEFLKERGEHES